MTVFPKLLVAIVLLLPFSNALGKWSGQCVTQDKLRDLNPQLETSPILFWRAKVEKEIGMAMVKIPSTGEILVNLYECQEAKIRKARPCQYEGDQMGVVEGDNTPVCQPLGDLWVPLANIADVQANDALSNFNLDHPTEYMTSRVSHHLGEYASDMKYDPYIGAAFSNVDHVFLASMGIVTWHLSTKYYVPKNFWQRMRRRGLQGAGIVLLIRQAYMTATGVEAEFVERRNQRSAHIENLIRQIDERMVLRLDGQDECRNLEESDGYAALINSIKRANKDTFEKFCKLNK